MIELLEACARIRSLSGQEGEVASFLRDQMAARGMQSHIDASGSAVGVVGTGSRQIVLLGHMDTVDGEVPVRYENGALYGRGTVDAKGPLCAFILATAQVAATTDLNDWQIVVIGATEEEAASSRGARHAAQVYRPQLCVIGEPSGADGITLGYKGRILTQAHVEQTSRHTAMPGPSAAEQGVDLWNWVAAYAQRYNVDKPKSFDQIMPTLREIASGDDGLREWCDLTIGLRLPVEHTPQTMQAEFEQWAAGKQIELLFRGHEVAYRSSRDSTLARAFVDAIRAEGMRPAFKHKTGTADFNVVGPVWQCPMVAYGPGDSTLDHTPVEHVEVAEFEKSVRVLARTLQGIVKQL